MVELISKNQHGTTLQGPKPKPIVGNLLDVPTGQLHQKLEDWSAEFFDPYIFHFLSEPYIASVDIQFIQYILKERPEGFSRSSRLRTLLVEIGLDGVFSAEGENWKQQRKIIADALKPSAIRHFLPNLAQLAQNHASKITMQSIFDPLPFMQQFTIAVTTALTFGPMEDDLHAIDELQSHLNIFFPCVADRIQAIIPWWRFFPTPSSRMIKTAQEGVRKHLTHILKKGREVINSNIPTSEYTFIEHLIAAGFSDDIIFANALTMLLAGEDTTANTLSWSLYYLAQDPFLQQQLRHEARAILGENSNQWKISLDQLAQLHWHEAIVNETLRLKSAAPFLILEANHNHTIPHSHGAIDVQQGQKVVALTRLAAILERNAPAKSSFQPEKWLQKIEGHAIDPKAFLPFGAGPRFCPGRFLSIVESKVYLAYLLAHHELTLDVPPNTVIEKGVFTMAPEGISIQITPFTQKK